jgi:hypothetical protein
MSDVQNIKIHMVGDADLSKLDAELNKITKSESALKDQLKAVDAQATAANKTLQEESTKSAKAVNASGKSIDDLKDKVKSLSSQIPGAFAAQEVLNFSKTVTSAGSSILGLSNSTGIASKAMNILKIAFAATGIGALVLAVGSLIAYFTKTEKGSEQLERAFAMIGATVDVLLGRVAKFGEGLIKLFSGDVFEGVEQMSGAFTDMGSEISNAADQAGKLRGALQDIEDEEKNFQLEIAKTKNQIQLLMIQAKNRTSSEKDRIDALNAAEELERGLIEKQISRQQRKIAALQVENNLKVKSGEIDKGNKTDALITAEVELENLRGNSLELLEKIHSKEDMLLDQRIANAEKRSKAEKEAYDKKFKDALQTIKDATVAEDNLYKQQYVNGEISEKEYQDTILNTQRDSLEAQRNLVKSYGKDTLDYDKQLLDLDVKQRKDADIIKQKLLDDEVKASEAAGNEKLKAEQKYQSDSEKQEKESKAKKAAIEQASVQLLTTISNGFFDLEKSIRTEKIAALERQKEIEIKNAGENKQAQAAINAKFAKQEAEIKRKQAVADKEQAIFNILIGTAQNVVKAFPNPALIALAAATGAVQVAFVAAKPIPKFNKGTKSVPGVDTGDDSILAMLRPGEGVMPVDKMKEYRPAFEAMYDGRIPADAINSLVLNYKNGIPSGVGYDPGLKSEIRALGKKLDKLKILEVNMDKNGIKTFLKSENAKTEFENNYLRS